MKHTDLETCTTRMPTRPADAGALPVPRGDGKALRIDAGDGRGRAPAIREILVVHHSHFDLGYTHSQPVAEQLQREFIDEALDMLQHTERWPAESAPKWTCEATWPVLQWLRTAGAEREAAFRRFLEQGRLAVGGWLCSTTPLCTAEQLAEQLYPMRRLRERFGLPIRFAMQHDVTGLPWPAVDLMLDAGIELFLMATNAHLGGKISPYPGPFRWVGPSGRGLLTFNGQHYSMFDQLLYAWDGHLAAMQRGWEECRALLDEVGYPHDFLYLTATHPPYAWDNSPPNLCTARLIRQWNEAGREPGIRYVTPLDLIERLRRVPEERIEARAGDWTDYWNFGCGSTAVETQAFRHAQRELFTADLIRPVLDCGRTAARRVRERACDNAHLFAEHTWGADRSMEADCPHVRAQHALKKQYAYQADETARYLAIDALEQLSGNPRIAYGPVGGVLVVNPGPAEYDGPVAVPAEWERSEKRIRAGRFRHAAAREAADAAPLRGPLRVPAYGWTVVPLDRLAPYAPAEPVRVGEQPDDDSPRDLDGLVVRRREGFGWIESPYHRLRYHLATGRIVSLVDKTTGWEVLDTDSDYTLLEYVRERPDPLIDGRRDAFYERDLRREKFNRTCWKPGWRAVYERPARPIEHRVEASPAAATLVLRLEAPGTAGLLQRITLHAHTPRIDFDATLDKPDIREPEATYFVLPLNLAEGWRAHFDTAGMPVEWDREQLDGSCRGWVTCERLAAMQDERHGLTLLTPDAPMVQFGGFNFGRCITENARPARPKLLAWPLNNYWNTNFPASQPGRICLRYGLLTHGALGAVELAERALAADTPVCVHPVLGEAAPRTGRLVNLDAEHVRLLHAKPAEDGRGAIVRLISFRDEPVVVNVGIGGRPARTAHLCSTLEDDIQPLAIRDARAQVLLPSRQIVTIRLDVG